MPRCHKEQKNQTWILFHDRPCRIIDSSQMHVWFLVNLSTFRCTSLSHAGQPGCSFWRHTPVNLWKRFKSRLVEGGCFDANDKKWKLFHSIWFTVHILPCVCAACCLIWNYAVKFTNASIYCEPISKRAHWLGIFFFSRMRRRTTYQYIKKKKKEKRSPECYGYEQGRF